MNRAVVAAAAALALSTPMAVLADPSPETVEQLRQPVVDPGAQGHYHRGVRARVMKDWAAAEAAFRQAIVQQPTFADAWNELGYALRNQRRHGESVDAYHEALRLRPEFPEALEYLGEAYVDMGKLDDARAVLARLRPLDAGRAQELAEAIAKGK
jgi:cytochrome c-type biogenesis protein CcmH/NrfG